MLLEALDAELELMTGTEGVVSLETISGLTSPGSSPVQPGPASVLDASGAGCG